MSKKKLTLKPKGKTNYKKIAFFLAAFSCLIFAICLALSYSNFYPNILDKKLIYSLDNFVASLPLLPKTPKQILTKALTNQINLNSYSLNLTGQVKNDKDLLVNLNVTGAIEKAGLLTGKESSKVKIESPLVGSNEFETFEDGDNFYFKIIKAAPIQGFDFSNVAKDTWYKTDLNSFQNSLGAHSKNDKDIVADISAEFNKLRAEVSKNTFPAVKDFKEITKDGKNYYQVKLLLNNLTLSNTFLGKKINTRDTDLELLISKETLFINSIILNTNSISDIFGGSREKTSASFKYQLSKINQNQGLISPNSIKAIQDPIGLFGILNPTTDLSGANFFTYSPQAADTSANFLTMERLLKVLILLPKAL